MGDFRLTVNAAICLLIFSTIKNTVTATGLGKCPIYPQLPNYNMRQMVGTWYEVERSFYLMELSASCTTINVDINEKGNMVIVTTNVNRWTGSPSTTYGLGIPSFEGSSLFRYKINNRMPYVIGRLLPGAGQYNVLFTDYTRFALIWSCTSVSIAHSDHIWVLGRTRELSADVRAQIYAIMEDLSLDPDRLILAKNNNCTDPQHILQTQQPTQTKQLPTQPNITSNVIN